MERTTLAILSDEEMADAFNRVYTDYVGPFTVTAEGLRQHIDTTDIALDHSPLWRDDTGAVVALAALGMRERRGWVGGFGVAPADRGQGISHALIAALLDTARRIGLREVALEVLTGNTRAIRTYQGAGFVLRRDLRTFRWDGPLATDAATDVYPAEPTMLLAHRARFGPPPAWQREARGVARISGVEALALGVPGRPEGFVIYRPSDGGVVIVDLAATAEGVAPLIGALAGRYPGRAMRLVNEPEESPLCGALEALGWREAMRQHEMAQPLRDKRAQALGSSGVVSSMATGGWPGWSATQPRQPSSSVNWLPSSSA